MAKTEQKTIFTVWKEKKAKDETVEFVVENEHFGFFIISSPDPDSPDPKLLAIGIHAKSKLMADIIHLASLCTTSTFIDGYPMLFNNLGKDNVLAVVCIKYPVTMTEASFMPTINTPFEKQIILEKIMIPLLDQLIMRCQMIRQTFRYMNILFNDTLTHQLDDPEFVNRLLTMEVKEP